MKSVLSKYWLIPAAGLLFAGTGLVLAEDYEEVRRLQDAGKILPLETILNKSAELYPDGRVIETEFDKEFDRYVYEIEVLDAQNVVWEVEFDARTGKVLNRNQDD